MKAVTTALSISLFPKVPLETEEFTYIKMLQTLILRVSRLPYRATLCTWHSQTPLWLRRGRQSLRAASVPRAALSSSVGLEEQSVSDGVGPWTAASTAPLSALRAPGHRQPPTAGSQHHAFTRWVECPVTSVWKVLTTMGAAGWQVSAPRVAECVSLMTLSRHLPRASPVPSAGKTVL